MSIIASTKQQNENINDLMGKFANQIMYKHDLVYSNRNGVNVIWARKDFNFREYNNWYPRAYSNTLDYVKKCVIKTFQLEAPDHVQQRVNVDTDIFVREDVVERGRYHYTIWVNKSA